MAQGLSPHILTVIQNSFVDKLAGAFGAIDHYAVSLFYIVAGLELVLFGIAWALRQEEALGVFLFKVLKLGVIFFIITSYPYLLQALINGFTSSAFHISADTTAKFFFNPAQLWQYGFDAGVSMLKLAVEYGTANIGMSLIYILLGFGTLLLFALIGAQVILVVVGFYVASLLALLMIPLGAFTLAKNLFEKAVQGVMQAGARVFILVLILGVAVTVWDQFQLKSVSKTMTLEKPLGLFFATLVFWLLCAKLPGMTARLVGRLGGSLFADMQMQSAASAATVNINSSSSGSAAASTTQGPTTAQNNMIAATSVAGSGVQVSGSSAGASSPGSSATNVAANVAATASGGSGNAQSAGAALNAGAKQQKMQQSVNLQNGISAKTLGKLKATFKEALHETKR